MKDQFLWVEKYRPNTVKDCILPKRIKDIFLGVVKSGDLNNFILSGPPGCGKTTIAKSLCIDLDYDYLIVNSSEENGIATLRDKLKNYASTVSIYGNRKCIILDESDYLTAEAQAALRGFIEEFSSNCSFILTCNFKNKLSDAIHSRCSVVDFTFTKEEKKELITEFYKTIIEILEKEEVPYNKSVIGKIILSMFPDFRKVLNELQKYSRYNSGIDSELLNTLNSFDFDVLFESLQSKDYGKLKGWVDTSIDNDMSTIYKKIYDNIKNYVTKESMPVAIITLAEYQDKQFRSANPEITLLACLTVLMFDLDWKK